MRRIIVQYFSVLLIAIIAYVRSVEHNPLLICFLREKFHFVTPAYLVNGEYVYDFYAPLKNSHLFKICPNAHGLLIATKLKMGYVKNNQHKCTENPVKSSLHLPKPDVHLIGYKVSEIPQELIEKTKARAKDDDRSTIQKEMSQAQSEGLIVLQFFLVITVTFDRKTASTTSVFYKHIPPSEIYVPEDTNTEKIKFNRNKEAYDQSDNIDLDALYAEAKKNANSAPYPVKRQLSPAGDFLLDVWKDATYHDINTAPMYNIFVKKWQSIEDEIRKILFRLESVRITVGTALFEDNSEPKYMKDNKFVRIPDLFYKIIVSVTDSDVYGIIIVMHNNPDLKVKPICKDVCEEYNWNGISSKDSTTERAYCCELNWDNLINLKVNLTGDFDLKMTLHTLNLKDTTIEVTYFLGTYPLTIDFLEWAKEYRTTSVIEDGKRITI